MSYYRLYGALLGNTNASLVCLWDVYIYKPFLHLFVFSFKAKMAFAGLLSDADITAALQACQGTVNISWSSQSLQDFVRITWGFLEALTSYHGSTMNNTLVSSRAVALQNILDKLKILKFACSDFQITRHSVRFVKTLVQHCQCVLFVLSSCWLLQLQDLL